jgi:hypothetical protein
MLRKLGSYGAFLQALSFIALMVLYMAIYPSEGFSDAMMNDVNQMLAFALSHGALMKLQFIIDLGFAIGIGATSLALYRRFRARNIDVSLLILGTGIVASALFLLAGGVGIAGVDTLIQISGGQVTQAFVAYTHVHGGIEMAAIFASGWSMFFAAFATMQSKSLKNWINALGYIGAASSILYLPLMLIDQTAAYAMMPFQIASLIFAMSVGFMLSGKAAQQAFELDLAGAR